MPDQKLLKLVIGAEELIHKRKTNGVIKYILKHWDNRLAPLFKFFHKGVTFSENYNINRYQIALRQQNQSQHYKTDLFPEASNEDIIKHLYLIATDIAEDRDDGFDFERWNREEQTQLANKMSGVFMVAVLHTVTSPRKLYYPALKAAMGNAQMGPVDKRELVEMLRSWHRSKMKFLQ